MRVNGLMLRRWFALGAVLSAGAVACGSSGSGGGGGGSAGTGGAAGVPTGGAAGASGFGGGGAGGSGGTSTDGGGGTAGSSVPDGWPMEWLKVVGGSEQDGLEDVGFTSSGKCLVYGAVSGGTDFGKGPVSAGAYRDVVIAELTATGDEVWVKTFTGPVDESAQNMAVTGDQVAIGATTSSTARTVKRLDATGAEIWSKSFTFNAGFGGVAVDGSGNVSVTAHGTSGNFGGGALPLHGQQDVFTGGLLAADGSQVWAHSWGGGGFDLSGAIAADSSGGVVVCGTHVGTADFGTGSIGGSGTNLFVAHLSSDGTVTWARSYPIGTQAKEATCSDVAIAPNGDALLTGWFAPEIDFEGKKFTADGISQDMFVLRLSSTGQIVWVEQYPGLGQEYSRAIAVASDGRVAFAGKLYSTITLGTLEISGQSLFIAELDPTSGAVKRAKRFAPFPFSGSDNEIGGIACAPSGSLVVVGSMAGPVIVEGVGYYDNGGGDGFVLSLVK